MKASCIKPMPWKRGETVAVVWLPEECQILEGEWPPPGRPGGLAGSTYRPDAKPGPCSGRGCSGCSLSS